MARRQGSVTDNFLANARKFLPPQLVARTTVFNIIVESYSGYKKKFILPTKFLQNSSSRSLYLSSPSLL